MPRGESRQYCAEQLSEYWDSGFSVQEYCELKEQPFENMKRWIRVFEKERNGVPEKIALATPEVPEPPRLEDDGSEVCSEPMKNVRKSVFAVGRNGSSKFREKWSLTER